MIDSKDILSLLSIPSEDISSVYFIPDSEDISFIEIELKDNRPTCPFCHSSKINIKDYYTTKIKNSVIRNNKLIVKVRMRRYVCKTCKKTFKQPFSFYKDKHSISKKVEDIIKNMLMNRVTMEYIAKELNVSKKTIINILDDMPNPIRLPFKNVICLDEFHFSNANHKAGKYPCVISNPFNSEIIDIVESRRKDYLIDYFQRIPSSERYNVKYYISDMNDTYKFIHNAFFPNSVYIVDHFHIVKLFTDAIQSIRIKIMNEYDKGTKEYKYLKSNWKLFLTNRWNLKDSVYVNKKTGVVYYTLDKIDIVLKAYHELSEIYWSKDYFSSSVLKLKEYEETKELIDFFIQKFENSAVKEIRKISRTFKNWYHEIINAYSKNTYGVVLTNAMAESNNNYIQTMINISYGYTNFKRLRKRILYMSSYKKATEK